MIQKIISSFTLLTLSALILGYVKLSSYYSAFQIDILYYVTPTEMLYTLLPTAFILLIFCYGVLQFNKIYLQPEESGTKKSVRMYYWLFVISIIGLILGLTGYIVNHTSFFYRYRPELVTIGLIFSASSTLLHKLGKKLNDDSFDTKTFFSVYAGLFFLCYLYGFNEAQVTKEVGPSEVYSFMWKGTMINSNDTFFNIGQTQGSMFLYNKNKRSTLVLNRDAIDSISIMDNKF